MAIIAQATDGIQYTGFPVTSLTYGYNVVSQTGPVLGYSPVLGVNE